MKINNNNNKKESKWYIENRIVFSFQATLYGILSILPSRFLCIHPIHPVLRLYPVGISP